MLYWRLAFRNLFRHKTRLILNLILLVGAFSAIVIFKGFKTYVLGNIADVVVDVQYGHVQIAKTSLWENAAVTRVTDRMIGEPDKVAALMAIPEVEAVSPRVSFYGLINTETKSQPTRFFGYDSAKEPYLQARLVFIEGKPFAEPRQAVISSGLQKLFKLKMGDGITIVSPTLDGSINAMDLTVTGVFQTGFSEMDNATVFLSSQDAQRVLDSDHVDSLIVRLKNPDDIENMKGSVKAILAKNAKDIEPGLDARTWRDLSGMYNQVANFFNFQNSVIEFILLVLLLLSVSNTMSMTVFERMSEIGTLRALGDYELDIQRLFFIEAVLLGALATVIAIPVSYLLAKGISGLQIPVTLPMASRPIPLQIVTYWQAYLGAILVCFISIVGASILPARKGSRTSIVEALRAKT